MPASIPPSTPHTPTSVARSALLQLWIVARIGVVCLVAIEVGAQPEPYPLTAQLREARDLAGIDPGRARAALARLRTEALRIGSLAARLEADEIDCRVLADLDAEDAILVGELGIAAAADHKPSGPELLNLGRLQACVASAMADTERHAEALVRIEALIEQTAGDGRLALAHALGLLERGVYRSRRGELASGQQDLLAACESLRDLGPPRDLELCMGHLANHYKRVGDLDDALRYLQQLAEVARARGARFDQGIYAFSLAQVHAKREDWAQALRFYEEALSLEPFGNDLANIAYAEGGIGDALLRSGRPQEAQAHLRRALQVLEQVRDAKQTLRVTINLALVQARLHDAARAVKALAGAEAAVRAMADPVLLSQWLEAEAEARAAAEDWRGAYKALAAFRDVDNRIQTQLLSDQSARLRAQFNSEKDALDMASLRQLNDRGQQLRRTQAAALFLFVLLLAVTLAYTAHKFRQAKRLQTLALSDDLTGLPNRRAVLARADTLRETARRASLPFSVLVIDVDHFKCINDTHGHAVGDEVLRHLALLLPVGLRASDCLGRIGGEEFLAVLPEASAAQAQAVAERMRQGIAQAPAATSAGELALTVSIGLASTDEPQCDVAELIRRADEALYAAKAQGRNRVVPADAEAVAP